MNELIQTERDYLRNLRELLVDENRFGRLIVIGFEGPKQEDAFEKK
jgi:hypothetical protein